MLAISSQFEFVSMGRRVVQPDDEDSSCYWEFAYDLQQGGDYGLTPKYCCGMVWLE
jgi:hypothetical protein